MYEFHPAAYLMLSLLAMGFIQAYPPILLFPALLLLLISVDGQAWRLFCRFAWRARWLLVLLWLFMAYGLPGEPVFLVMWLPGPTYEGIRAANEHGLRLLTMLSVLARLLSSLNHQQLLMGLWFICKPLTHLAMDTERAVVRVMLVWDQIQHLEKVSDWRQWLSDLPANESLPVTCYIQEKYWSFVDTLGVFIGGILLVLGVMF